MESPYAPLALSGTRASRYRQHALSCNERSRAPLDELSALSARLELSLEYSCPSAYEDVANQILYEHFGVTDGAFDDDPLFCASRADVDARRCELLAGSGAVGQLYAGSSDVRRLVCSKASQRVVGVT